MRGQVSISGYPKGEGYTRVRDVLGRPPLGAHRDLSAEGGRQCRPGWPRSNSRAQVKNQFSVRPLRPRRAAGRRDRRNQPIEIAASVPLPPSNHALRRLRERVELAPASFLPSREPYRRHPVPRHDHLLGRPLPRGTAASDAITAQQKPGTLAR